MCSRFTPSRRLALMLLAPALLVCAAAVQAQKPAVLIVHGQNNHDNDRTAAALRAILEATGKFEVHESRTPAAFEGPPRLPKEATPAQKQAFETRMADYMKRRAAHDAQVKPEWDAWSPDFAAHEVVVLSYNGEAWPRRVEQALEEYLAGGGRLVNVHAANNPFPDWEAFNRMIGLGWRGAEFGFRVTVNEDGSVNRIPPGEDKGAGHGQKHPYPVKIHVRDHAITQGLPEVWMHGYDELYHAQRGPAEDMHVLASAFDSEEIGGTGKREPMVWIIPFGQGQVVTNVMGHLGRDQQEMDALYCAGFQTLFARSVEWCATGEVTLPVPAEFPGPDEPVVKEPSAALWSR